MCRLCYHTNQTENNTHVFVNVMATSHFQFLYQVLSFGMIVSSALMIWKGLMVVTGSESPIVVVLRFVCIIKVFLLY